MRMTEQKKATISIITATYNAAAVLPRLIESLMAQTDQDFEWVVADGGSTDETLELLEKARLNLRNVVIDSRPDFGIYDAMNRAIGLASAEYYLVAGGDDYFNDSAVENYKDALLVSDANIVTAGIEVDGIVRGSRFPGWLWLYGPGAKLSSHSIGVAIKKSLHEKFGCYDLSYRIYSDSDFFLKILKAGEPIYRANFVAGCFSSGGISNNNKILSFSEQLRSEVENGSFWLLSLILFFLRVFKWGVRGALVSVASNK
jgi:glycosyltransferase involved in cell wall biosynthesis